MQGDEDTVSHLSLKIKGNEGITLSSTACLLPEWEDPRENWDTNVDWNVSIDDCLEAVETVLPIVEVGSCISGSELGGSWPRDF
jgi:hypothetical protein